MDRRTFLSRSALGTGALALGVPAIAASGCGAATSRSTMAASDASALLARLERGLGRVRGVRPGTIARAMRGHPQPELMERVVRLGLEALVLLDVTRSVPQGAALPAGLAQRLGPELPVLDRYTATYATMLSEMPHTARRRLTQKVRERPAATMEIAGWIDDHARSLDVASESRLMLRAQASDVDVRMRRQSPGAVVDDCVAKVGRVVERSGASIALARSSATSAMLAAIWQDMDDLPGGGSGLGAQLNAPTSAPAAGGVHPELRRLEEDRQWTQMTTPERSLWSPRWGRPGDEEVEIGAILMPFGAVTCGLLLIIGLITALVGASQNSSWDGLPRASR